MLEKSIIILDKMRWNSEPEIEAFVENCDHCHDDTIFIANNPKHYKKQALKHDWIDIMTSIISHEYIHSVLTRLIDSKTSRELDNLFGTGTNYKREYHGLCRLEYRLRDYGN